MMHKRKAVRDHYAESLSINSASLTKQLAGEFVPEKEIGVIMDSASKLYHESVDRIAEECDRDMMALERVPSPLKLFVDCLAQVRRSRALSPPAARLIERYAAAWEDWM